MSDDSTPTIPYVHATAPESETEFSLHPNFVYKAAHDLRGSPALLKQPGTYGMPSFQQASQLDTHSDRYRCVEGTDFTLVTEKGEKPLAFGSIFYTEADNTVKFPSRSKPQGILKSDGHTSFASTSESKGTKHVHFDETETEDGD